jgi:hypothetical protein
MRTQNLILILIAVTITGCSKSESERLADMAERHLQRQAEQNRQMSELQHEVAEGSRQLVEADARAREEMVLLQRDIQVERAELDRQRNAIDGERRDLAAKRHLDPIIAAAITNVGLVLTCILPLVLCWYLLRQPPQQAGDQEIADLLIEDLVADQPLLPAPGRQRDVNTHADPPAARLYDAQHSEDPLT